MCDINRLTEPLQCVHQRTNPQDWNRACGLAWYVEHVNLT